MYSSRTRAVPSLGLPSMLGSAPILPLPAHPSHENSTKTAAFNHPPASVLTPTRTMGPIHHPPEFRTIDNNAHTFVATNGQESEYRFVKNTTENPIIGFSKASQPYHNEYHRQASFSQQPTQFSYTPGRGSVALAPAASGNNAEARSDPVNRRDYVVIDVRDFGNDMNDDLQATRRSKLTWKAARDLFT